MEVTASDQGRFEIKLNRTQLDVLRQCLNEVCNGIAVPEFQTRIGADVEEVRTMLELLRNAVR
jgi:hypothetical protein